MRSKIYTYELRARRVAVNIALCVYAATILFSVNAWAGSEEVVDYVASERLSGVLSGQLIASKAFLCEQSNCEVGTVLRPSDRSMYQKFDMLRIRPGGQYKFTVGDTVDIVERLRNVSFRRTKYPLLRVNGQVVVRSIDRDNAIVNAELIHYWKPISGRELVMPSQSYQKIEIPRLISAAQKLEGVVVTHVEDGVVPYLKDLFIVDIGKNSGIRIGDVFTVFGSDSGDFGEEFLVGTVINSSSSFSTLVINKIHQSSLSQGDRVVLTMRIGEE